MKQSMTVDSFKNDMRSYRAYQKRIAAMEEEMEELYRLLAGVRSPSLEMSVHGQPDKDKEYRRRERIEECRRESAYLRESITRVDRMLARMDDEMRWACTEKFIKGRTFRSVSMEMHLSVNALNMRIIREIERVLR